MKKSLVFMIAILLVGALMISCNSEVSDIAGASDSLVNVTVMANSSKAIQVNTTSGTDVEELYWFYTANKTDGSIFITGDTGSTKTPVKTDTNSNPTVGLANSDLGLFSTGGWKFSFWGYKASDVTIGDNSWSINQDVEPVYYQEDLVATVVAKTDLTLTLVEGEGMMDATVVISNPTWTYALAGSGKELTLKVYDGETELDLNGSTTGTSVSATTGEGGVATFSGVANQTLSSGAHTLYFKVFYGIEEVGSTSIGLNLKKGTTYTLTGSIEDLNETYHVWVKTVNQTTVVSTASAIETAQAVSIPATVTPLAAESSTAVTETEKTTTVVFESGALAHNTSTVTPEDSDGNKTTTTTTSTHDLEVEVKTAATASSSTYVVEHDNTPVAGIDLTLTKNTTVTETVTNGTQQVSSNTTTSSAVVTEFNNTYVTIRTYIAKNLSGVKVYYNGTSGEQPKFSEAEFASASELGNYTDSNDSYKNGTGYVPSTGLLVFKTNHFSEFFVTSNVVATIGNAYYCTLEDAFSAVPTDGTKTVVTMINNASVSSGLTVSSAKNIVLDLNGFTVSGNTNSSTTYALITNIGTLTIKDSSDVNKNGTGNGLLTTYITNADQQDVPGYASNTVTNHGTLIVESGKIVNNGNGYACYAIDNVTNGSLYNPVLTINGGRFVQNNAYTYAIRMFCNSTTNSNSVTVNGGVIEGGYAFWLQTPNNNSNVAELIVNGGEFIARDGYALYFGGSGSTSAGRDYSKISISLNGGTLNRVMFGGVSSPEKAPKVIDITSENITELAIGDNVLAKKQYVVHDNGNGKYTIVPAAFKVNVEEDNWVSATLEDEIKYVDMYGFWGMNANGCVDSNNNQCPRYVLSTDETSYRDVAVTLGQSEDYVSAKYLFDSYLTSGKKYEGKHLYKIDGKVTKSYFFETEIEVDSFISSNGGTKISL